MADETQLLYLEPDDEITTVVRRLREADASRVVVVASGRTKATTSAVALRLLSQVAAEEGREVVLVADAAARSLAAEAGIPAFGSVAEANAEGASPAPAPIPVSAPIHVVRGEAAPTTVDEPLAALPPAPPTPTPPTRPAPMPVRGMEETQEVRIAPRAPRPPPRSAPRATRRPSPAPTRLPLIFLAVMLALLVGMGAAVATVLPAASITIRPRPIDVGPLEYSVTPEVQPSDADGLTATATGEATGQRTRRTAATGTVLLINYSDTDVPVPTDTVVSAGGEILFGTTQEVTVPDANFFFPGTATTTIEALEPGPSGNVDELAIDRIEDREIDRALRGQGSNERRIRNEEPTEGGDERELLVVRKSDVQLVKDEIRADLVQQAEEAVAGAEDRIYAGDPPRPRFDVPDDLVGQVSDEEQFTFELTGRLVDRRPYVLQADAEGAAVEMALADAPGGATIDESTIQVELDEATRDGETITVPATVTAQAIPEVNVDALRTQLAGLTAAEARERMADIGPAQVDLWPGWVERVPGLAWRVSIEVRPAEPRR